MDYFKNELIDKTLLVYYKTFAQTLDTGDFTPQEFNKKIHKYIYKNLKSKFNEIEIYNLLHLQENGYKLGVFQKLKIFFSGVKPLYLAEQKQIAIKAQQKEERRLAKLELQRSKKKRKVKCGASVKENADYFCGAKIDEPPMASALDNGTNETN